ncbi:YfiR family protein [Bacterioplanes sanyensis]|nr:YfiR family protein [Bacterioplanes sanyensis]
MSTTRAATALLASGLLMLSQGADSRQNVTKLQLLSKMAQFIHWPASDTRVPTTLCVFSESSLKALQQEQRDSGSQVPVLRLWQPGLQSGCHMLYVAHRHIDKLVNNDPNCLGIAIITDELSGLNNGASLALIQQQQHFRLAVNMQQVRRCQLQLDSNLLELALPASAAGSH